MAGDDWIALESGGDGWVFDADFLRSEWKCIWDSGCAGIGDRADPESQLGCCSVGAQMLDEDEAMRVAALGASLNPSIAQFAAELAEGGALRETGSVDVPWATRVVDGACIFLNRPGYSGGAGCALHLAALSEGEEAIDWKPSICWQLPIKIETVEDTNGASKRRLRRWLRSDWGVEGEDMAYCCTERDSTVANAYVADSLVIESLSTELEALLGHDLYSQLRDRLEN